MNDQSGRVQVVAALNRSRLIQRQRRNNILCIHRYATTMIRQAAVSEDSCKDNKTVMRCALGGMTRRSHARTIDMVQPSKLALTTRSLGGMSR